jgi:hypothetical protein
MYEYYPIDQFPLWNRRTQNMQDDLHLLNIDEKREAGVVTPKWNLRNYLRDSKLHIAIDPSTGMSCRIRPTVQIKLSWSFRSVYI